MRGEQEAGHGSAAKGAVVMPWEAGAALDDQLLGRAGPFLRAWEVQVCR